MRCKSLFGTTGLPASVIAMHLALQSFSIAHAASIQEIEIVPIGAGGWIASYALLADARVIANASQWSPGGHPFNYSPSVDLGNYWGSSAAPGPIAFYEVTSLGLMRDPSVHYVLMASGTCYARPIVRENYPPAEPQFEGTQPVLVGDFWDGAPPPASIIEYEVERDGNTGVADVVVHLVFLADGTAWYRVSGGTPAGPFTFNQSPYFLGQFHTELPLPIRTKTLGGVKSIYR